MENALLAPRIDRMRNKTISNGGIMNYREAYTESIESPASFWGKAAEAINWDRRWDTVLDDTRLPFCQWFKGGRLNTCFNAVDRHVQEGRGSQPAIIYDSPVTGTTSVTTFQELLDRVARIAGFLKGLGVEKGDTVIVYMPMIPEAVLSMLACARLGAIHSVVFGGFAARELAVRIDDARPKAILSASCGIEVKRVIPYKPLLDEAIRIAVHKPEHCVILQRPMVEAPLVSGRDHDWTDLEAHAHPAGCVSVEATDPLYILYTSGTTGRPKGVVRDNGGHAVALAWSMKHIYNIGPGDVYWAASDVGWVVGHSYIVYAPLFVGATTIVYEGKPVGTPDPGAFWRVVSEHGVKTLFTAPTAIRAIKREDAQGAFLKPYDLSRFEALFLAGERTDPDTYHWASRLLQRPVIDHWWQTETGWAIAGNFLGLETFPVKPGSATKPMPGYNLKILDPTTAKELGPNENGMIVVKLPLPPSNLPTLWKDDERFLNSYMKPYPGYYLTGDGGYMDEDGYVFVMGRVDDVLNVAGHRLSTGGMEEVLSRHPDVAECAVVGAADDLKGQVPVGMIVLKSGVDRPHEEIIAEVVRMVREEIGAVASFKKAVVVKRLPKTRSGKILRGTMRKLADGEAVAVPSTIDDPVILDEIRNSLVTIGYGPHPKKAG
ncbi:propionyl-CoA synthetase [uncultured Desulfatiglans sp.]|uniref:Propionyl-CoA synthetase n=1 Tax=Uncultured Desulfatiglans sp. TaxID=1748965 RepID=A0A653A696_UNCDX|nr:propionyl-CoA synthetase [uncultured Desulfatiglans sp.]